MVPENFGVNIHFTGDGTPDLVLIKAAGFSLIRMDMMWRAIEKVRGQYDFSAWDKLYASCKAHSIRPLFILGYSNSLYPKDFDTTAYLDGYAKFVQSAAKHFQGDNIIWEVGNEPDLDGLTAAQYMKLSRLPRVPSV